MSQPITPVASVLLAALSLACSRGSPGPDPKEGGAAAAGAEHKVLYWKSPMDPSFISKILGTLPSRPIVCHLGSGYSVTAVEDPGVPLHFQQYCEVGSDELRETLTKRSGLRRVSGISGDLSEVLEAADGGSSRARLAYERFELSIRRALSAKAGVLGGVDAVVFTGGIGENSARVRRDATSALRFAGLELAEDANASNNADRGIAAPGSRVHVLVLRAREDLAIPKEMLRLRRRADIGPADERIEGSS